MLKKLASALSAALLIAAPAMAQYVNYPIAPINTPITTPQDAANSALSKVNAYLQANPVSGLPTNNPTFTGTLTGPNTALTAMNGWPVVFGAQQGVSAYVTGGTGYAIGDVLTLNDGCATHTKLTVTNVTSGAVTAAQTAVVGTCNVAGASPISVLSTTGSGSGATFNVPYQPISIVGQTGTLNSNGGNTFLGQEQGTFGVIAESTIIGDRACANCTTGSFSTVIGHDAAGLGNGCTNLYINGGVAIGTDVLRNWCGGESFTAIGGSVLYNENQVGNSSNHILHGVTAIGSNSLYNWNSTYGFQWITAVGDNSCDGATGASFNEAVCIGNAMGPKLTTAQYFIMIGAGNNCAIACNNFASGQDVLLIDTGYSQIDTPAANTSHYTNINGEYINYSALPTITTGQALGTTPAITGTSSHVFKAVVGASATGTTETLTFGTAPNGWMCVANDVTTSANTAKITASSATSVTMTWSGTLTASDVILHMCDAY